MNNANQNPIVNWIAPDHLGTRWDAEFFSPIYDRVLRSLTSSVRLEEPLEFQTVALGEICEIRFARRHRQTELEATDLDDDSQLAFTVVRARDVVDGLIRPDRAERVRLAEDHIDRFADAIAPEGSLLINTMTDAFGTCVLVEGARVMVPDYFAIVMLRPQAEDYVDRHYLWLYFNNEQVSHLLARRKAGIAIRRLPTEMLNELEILLPMPDIQEALGAKFAELTRIIEQAFRDRLKLLTAPSIEEMVIYEPQTLRTLMSSDAASDAFTRDQIIQTSFPFPLAFGHMGWTRAEEPVEKYRLMVALAEQTLRFLGILFIADYLSSPVAKDDIRLSLKSDLAEPSDRQWWSIAQDCAARRIEDLPIPNMRWLVERSGASLAVERLIELLNELRPVLKSGELSSELDRCAKECRDQLNTLLDSCQFLAEYRMLHVEYLEPNPRLNCVHAALLQGSSEDFQSLQLESPPEVPIYTGLYLALGDNTPIIWLHPFLIVSECQSCGRERVFTYNGLQPGSPGAIRYKEYQRGHCRELADYRADLDYLYRGTD